MFEKVNPQHPDKVADRIAGAIVDLAYAKSRNPKVACEVLIGHGRCDLQIETSEDMNLQQLEHIVHRIAGNDIVVRATVVPQDIHLAGNQQGQVRCGDNGIFKGCAPTREQKMLTAIATSIYEQHPHDGKYIIVGSGRLAQPDYDVTVCQSHMAKDDHEALAAHLQQHYGIRNVTINPLGEWTGGPDVDCGATNRKLGSDMGDGVTGGGLHGKDLSKADVSVNIWCYLESIRRGETVTACCAIGDETVNGVPYADIVEQARLYILTLGGFERFAEWGLIRAKDE